MKTVKTVIIAGVLLLTAAPLFSQEKGKPNKTIPAMKMMLIDKLTVPAAAKEEFIKRMKVNREIIHKIDGFEKDEVYQRVDENGNFIFVTVATWKSQDHLKKAKEQVEAEYQRTGFDVASFIKKLGITIERGTYTTYPQE